MTVFAVRVEVLRALQADPVWFEKACKCRNVKELQEVVCEFGRAKGWKVVEVTA